MTTYTLTGADGHPYESEVKGQWGGHRRTKIYGRLDCPSALRAIAHGDYTWRRAFFADETTAIAAGYRHAPHAAHEMSVPTVSRRGIGPRSTAATRLPGRTARAPPGR